MIQLKDIKKNLFLNADKFYVAHQKDKVVINGFELKLGTRLVGSVTNRGKLVKFYFTVVCLEPAVIAYWIQGEYAIYIEPVNFEKLLKKRDLEKRTAKSGVLRPQNFKKFPQKTLNAGEIKQLLWKLPRLQQSEVKSAPNALVLTSPQLIYDFARFVTSDKEDILGWMIELASKAGTVYHNAEENPMLTDDQYDELKDFCLKIDPKKAAKLKDVGAEVPAGREKIKLPFPMGSQEKIKPGGGLEKFIKASKDSKYVRSLKLDGISLQFGYSNGKLMFASTRGKGLIGQNVLRHAPHMGIPQTLKGKYAKGQFHIRCEGILTKSDFKKLQSVVFKDDKKKEPYNDARTMVGGVLNRTKSCMEVFKRLKVISYSIMNLCTTVDKADQLDMLKEMGFTVVPYEVLSVNKIGDKMMVEHINKNKDQGDYELDGSVLEANSAKIRSSMGNETNSLNPRFSRAFKTGDTEKVEMEVKEVQCNVSKYSILIPKIIFKEPKMIGGVMVKQTAGFNYEYIYDNKIGPGSKLLMTRSGDVIPHVVQILTKTKAQLPDPKVVGDYDWDDNEVNLVLNEAGTHEDARIKTIVSFFSAIGVENFKSGTASKFYDAGFDTIDKVITMTIKDMLKIDGIQQSSANKIYGNIHAVLGGVELTRLAAASPYFDRGFGRTRMNKIYEKYGEDMFNHWVGKTINEVVAEISKIAQFDKITAKQFASGIAEFRKFLKRNKDFINIKEKEKLKLDGNALAGLSFLWSKVRQHSLEPLIVKNGGEVFTSFKKGLTYLIAPEGETSDKIKKAQSLGTKILGPDDMIKLLKSKGIKGV